MKFLTPDFEQICARLIFSTKFMIAWKKLNFWSNFEFFWSSIEFFELLKQIHFCLGPTHYKPSVVL